MSGRAIKPITLRLVSEAFRAVRIPIIGLGGISSAEDVLEYMVAGATAVQIGTASFADPKACEHVVEELGRLCMSAKICNINALTGTLGAKND